MTEKREGGASDGPLAALRDEIADVDRALLELLRRRMALAAKVGRVKHAAAAPIFVPEVGDRVLTRAREHAAACGVSTEVMESIFEAVIRGSIERQHRVGVELESTSGSRLLILGGAGNMGAWFAHFAKLLGHGVDLVDPSLRNLPPCDGVFARLEDIADLDPYEAILIAVPLAATRDVLASVVARRPAGVVVEIASIKDHLSPVLEAATAAGVQVASLHPMFGPGKSIYESLTFVLAYRDDPQVEQARVVGWLRHPYSHLVPVPFAHHDRLMGWLLGLAHLAGMVFGSALTSAGLSIAELRACASTTYDRQVQTALSVLDENPDLYYEIQRLNPHRGEVYRATRAALDALISAVESDDREAFRSRLTAAREMLRADR